MFGHAAGEGDAGWTEIPPAAWKGAVGIDVAGRERAAGAVVAWPASEAQPLTASAPMPYPPGLYAVRLTLRPSHTTDAIAFHTLLRAGIGRADAAEYSAYSFARTDHAEIRTFQAVYAGTGPLTVRLEARTDSAVVERARAAREIQNGGPATRPLRAETKDGGRDDDVGKLVQGLSLDPETTVYVLVDRIEVRLLSRSGRVRSVTTDKIRYRPGETLRGVACVEDVGGQGGSGLLRLWLERGLRDRVEVASYPVMLSSSRQTIPFECPLPQAELGYAVVAEYVSADGVDRSEAAEYFTIAENFHRVALFGGNAGGTRDVTITNDEPILKALAESRAEYYNVIEYFAWAPDDLLELTPEEDYWFSGQANYHMNKQTLQRQIRLAHAQGMAVVTYGKWCVSGAPGWEAVYTRPWDFDGAYRQPIGSWSEHNTWIFDLRRNGEQVPYSRRPRANERWFDDWWNEFLGIGPNATPALIRTAAEEMAASVAMFGWDGIRWDDHIRVGWNAAGRSGTYQRWAARQTQALMRYYKDLLARRCPGFRHGYNYLLIEKNKGYEWAKENYELDELCRDGGLLMNESIGNASGGWTFDEIAQNLQVDGDLCRERGGFYLGISFAKSPRDRLIESALWAAAGCRPYNSAMTRETRRYLTRFAPFALDERLKRIARPEAILTPERQTTLDWRRFVYETPEENGRRHIVVNALNLPWNDRRPTRDGNEPPVWDRPPGTEPVGFRLNLPVGLTATGVFLIRPERFEVERLEFRDGGFVMPPVALWDVIVIEMDAETGAPSLGELYGPPRTLNQPRSGENGPPLPEVWLDPEGDPESLAHALAPLTPEWIVRTQEEEAAFQALSPPEREKALRRKRAEQTLEKLTAQWWKGGVLPDDLRYQNQRPDYGDLTPERNGRLDVFYGRGAMDHRLRVPEALARFSRVRIHDAPFWGAFRGGGLGHMGLMHNIPWRCFSEFDLLLFTGIPYAAIGVENAYALPAYVRAGGAVLFTGGEWAFGKGGYLMTVLDRELLPVQCVEMDDGRTSARPIPMVPGPDFAELGCPVDFSATPVFWVYNRVLLREDSAVKVFLTSEQGPVLVGWTLGRGRVACLLVDYRGRSKGSTTAFFDWAEWPRLLEAVIRWLTPEAVRVEPRRTVPPQALTPFLEAFKVDSLADVLGEERNHSRGPRNQRGGAEQAAVLRRLLDEEPEKVDAPLLLDALLTPGEWSQEMRWAMVDAVRRRPPAGMGERIQAALLHEDSRVRQNAIQLLGLVDGGRLLEEMKRPSVTLESDVRGRFYAFVLALPLVQTRDLVGEGRRRVEAWNASEKEVLDRWTGGRGFSTAAPETPGLEAEALLERLAWLAYLARFHPRDWGAQFVREWLKTGVYQEYGIRTKANERQVGRGAGDWDRLIASFGRLGELTRPIVEALFDTAPEAVADGLARAHFTREVLAARNLLGDRPPDSIAAILERVSRTASHPDLVAFAKARLQEKSR